MFGGGFRRLRVAAIGLSIFAWAEPARAVDFDLTSELGANPGFATAIEGLCKSACIGNERKSWLDAIVLHAELGGPSVTLRIKLRSRHVPMRHVVLYDNVATVTISADVSIVDCSLGNVRISSNNDIYRLLLAALKPQIQAAVRRRKFC